MSDVRVSVLSSNQLKKLSIVCTQLLVVENINQKHDKCIVSQLHPSFAEKAIVVAFWAKRAFFRRWWSIASLEFVRLVRISTAIISFCPFEFHNMRRD